MAYDEFITDGDKPYSENLNDSLLLCDAFDVTVPCEMPGMFSNGDFSSSVNTPRKCGVSIVTLKSVDSGVTVGTDEISGTGTVVFRVYPNFNSFYKWQSIVLEKTGNVEVSFKKIDGSDISASVGADGTISEASALKELQEIDVVFSLTSATISNILICFVNNHSSHTRVNALLEADQLVNVNGTVTAGDGKAVSGATVKTALDNLHSTVTGEIEGEIEDLSDSVDSDLSDLSDTVSTKESLSNKVTTLDNSDSHYPSCSAVNSAVNSIANNKENVQYTKFLEDEINRCKYTGYYNNSTVFIVAELTNFSIAANDTNTITVAMFERYSEMIPRCIQRVVLPKGLYARIDSNTGSLAIINTSQQAVNNLNTSFSFMYVLSANLISG